jgi:hypothetical protein
VYAFIIIATIIILLVIAYQDYDSRSVQWIYFPLLGVAGVTMSYINLHSIYWLVANFLFNVFFLALQFAVLKIYFIVKNKDDKTILNKKIGTGDILFLLAACFFFSPVNFIAFYLCSLLFIVIVYLIGNLFKNRLTKTSIPMAGLQSIFLIGCMLFAISVKYSLVNDNWLILKLSAL